MAKPHLCHKVKDLIYCACMNTPIIFYCLLNISAAMLHLVVCFPEAKVIEEHFIEHFIFLQTSKNIRHTIEEVGNIIWVTLNSRSYYLLYFDTNSKLSRWSHWSGGSVPGTWSLQARCCLSGPRPDPNRTRIIRLLIPQLNLTLKEKQNKVTSMMTCSLVHKVGKGKPMEEDFKIINWQHIRNFFLTPINHL